MKQIKRILTVNKYFITGADIERDSYLSSIDGYSRSINNRYYYSNSDVRLLSQMELNMGAYYICSNKNVTCSSFWNDIEEFTY